MAIHSAHELRQTYFPPFEAALRAGALTFMSSFNANDGIPASCNRQLLHDVLRDQWGFKGFVVSDCFSVRVLIGRMASILPICGHSSGKASSVRRILTVRSGESFG